MLTFNSPTPPFSFSDKIFPVSHKSNLFTSDNNYRKTYQDDLSVHFFGRMEFPIFPDWKKRFNDVVAASAKPLEFLPLYHRLKKMFTIRHETKVRDFLMSHPPLISFLIDGYPYIRKYFPDFEIVLEVVYDPESIDDIQLFAYIQVPLIKGEQALDSLHTLDQEWFLDQVTEVANYFNFNLEFV